MLQLPFPGVVGDSLVQVSWHLSLSVFFPASSITLIEHLSESKWRTYPNCTLPLSLEDECVLASFHGRVCIDNATAPHVHRASLFYFLNLLSTWTLSPLVYTYLTQEFFEDSVCERCRIPLCKYVRFERQQGYCSGTKLLVYVQSN